MTRELAINLDEATHQRLNFIGETTSLTQNELAENAIRTYSQAKQQYVKAVKQGQEDIRNGKVTIHCDLIKDLESRFADLG